MWVVEADKPDAQMTISGIIGNFVFWCVIFVSQPYLCSRFLAIPDVSRKTIGVFLITALILTVIYNSFYIAGLTGRVLFPDADPDHLTVIMAINLLPQAMAALMKRISVYSIKYPGRSGAPRISKFGLDVPSSSLFLLD